MRAGHGEVLNEVADPLPTMSQSVRSMVASALMPHMHIFASLDGIWVELITFDAVFSQAPKLSE